MVNLEQLDIVYIVKDSEDNEELRYSLRSVEANFPHARVVIVGYKPSWVQNVYHLWVDQDGRSKYENIDKNWSALLRDDEISDSFVIFNDDFFVTKPIVDLPVVHSGYLESHIEKLKDRFAPPKYIQRIEYTNDLLKELGYQSGVKNFEVHMPMVINKEYCYGILSILSKRHSLNCEIRSLYGNMFWAVGSIDVYDCKVRGLNEGIDPAQGFMSTSDRSFKYGIVGEQLRDKFQSKSRYEV